MTVRAVFEVTRLNTHDMAKKIQAYIDAPVIDPPDQHTKLIASVVAAPLADADPVRCVTLIDHEGNKHERTFTESEVREMCGEVMDRTHGDSGASYAVHETAENWNIILDSA